MTEPLTALVVEVPEAEPAVGAHRARLDAFAAAGVPPHGTVLFPFLPAASVDDPLLDRLTALFAPMPSFPLVLDRTAWFGEDLLYLAPADDTALRLLTNAAWSEFPDHPPYGGAFTDLVPHVTIGHGHPVEVLRRAEAEIAPHLPITGTVTAVSLLAEDDAGRWSRRARFPLAGAGD